jgi:DNA-binding NtrC family response regulator
VDAQSFRGDLYARLAELPLQLPPLRERRDDVLVLLAHALGSPPPKLDPDLAERLLLHGWPYNVREVFSLAKQLRIRGGAGPYGLELVDDQLGAQPQPPEVEREEASEEREPPPDRAKLEALLRRHGGVVADVAREMSRSRKQVYRWIAHHGIDVASFRR